MSTAPATTPSTTAQSGASRSEEPRQRSNVEILILSFNEEVNISHALKSVVGWADKVYVVDSNSTDNTKQIAEEMGATVIEQEWLGYSRQKNWALDNLPLQSDWVFILDADEWVSAELIEELKEIASVPAAEIEADGYYVNRLTYFLNKPIKHCGYFPSWNLRFFKRGRARYEDRDVHEHMIVDGQTSRLKKLMYHHDRRGLEHFIAKHNRYSSLESMELIRDRVLNRQNQAQELDRGVAWRRWLKYHVQPRLPFVFFWRFVYMFVIQRGFLDGLTGFRFCLLLSMYDFFISLKLLELKRRGAHRNAELVTQAVSTPQSGLAIAEGKVGSEQGDSATSITQIRESLLAAEMGQLAPESSPWTLKEKILRALWMLTGRPLFRWSFHNWYGFRSSLLRLFGAKVGKDVRLRPSVHIEIPWNLKIASGVTIGDYAILYSLGEITIGARTIISQYAHLCAGTHDYTDRTFRLLRPEIRIGEDAWIGADAFVGPGVSVGNLAVLGARSSTYRSLDAGMVYVGNPAKALKERGLQ